MPSAFALTASKKSKPGLPLESWQWAVLAAAAISFGCKLLLALKTYGTNDVYGFEQTLEWWHYLGPDLFRLAPSANNPPTMLYLWNLLRWLSQTTGLAFSFWAHVPAILADLGSLWLVWRILEPRMSEPSIRWALLLMASAPALVLISGFHGQNDSVMIFFLLLSARLVERGHTVSGGAAFGLSLCVKVAPVIAAPALLFYQFGRRRWIAFFAVAGGVVLAAWWPFLIRDPRALFTDLFGYRSGLGHWGLSYFTYQVSLVSPLGTRLCALIERLGSPLLLFTIAAVSWWMNRLTNKPSPYSQIGLVLFLFLAGTNGFGVQYLAWLVPFAVSLGAAPMAVYCATSGAFLFLVYDYWSQGMPWYLADSIRVGDYYFAGLDYFHIVCWLSVIALLWESWRQIQCRKPWEVTLMRAVPAWRWLTVGFAGLLLLVPMIQWLRSPHTAWPSNQRRGEVAVSVARQWYLQDLSMQLAHMGRTGDSADAARRAVIESAPQRR